MPWWVKTIGGFALIIAFQVALALFFLGVDGTILGSALGVVGGVLMIVVVALFVVGMAYNMLSGRR